MGSRYARPGEGLGRVPVDMVSPAWDSLFALYIGRIESPEARNRVCAPV